MTWNTPKPGEWKSEELSQGRIIDYKAFNFSTLLVLVYSMSCFLLQLYPIALRSISSIV